MRSNSKTEKTPSPKKTKDILKGKDSEVGDPVPESTPEARPQHQAQDPKAGLKTKKTRH